MPQPAEKLFFQSLPPTALRRVMRELSELKSSPPEGIRIQTSEEDMLDVTGIIQGPGWFATKIFHPNVSNAGEICVNTLKKDWKSTYGIGHILVTVKCLLIYPNPESALDEEAGKLLLEDYQSYCSRAKLITSVHATPRKRPVEFDTPSAEEPNAEASSSASTSQASKTVPPPPAPTNPTSPPTVSVPILTRKSASPAPSPKLHPGDKEGIVSPNKERHVSPSPLGTADANVGAKTGPMMSIGMTATPSVTGSKAVKRAAVGGAAKGAEKRKKALKRL
ncbi:hypothetical protein H0H87_007881 [Tephrocybe sp. NHM501043]|nr:hypothetical protein H0H87_007881 [Tephrocybe sp. NHM501043]